MGMFNKPTPAPPAPTRPVTGASVYIQSFGYHYIEPSHTTVTIDVRGLLHDPHADPAMREMTGRDDTVYRHVLAARGAIEILDQLEALTNVLLSVADPLGAPVHIAIGDDAGRHRSVVIAAELARRLATGHDVTVVHRHLDRAAVRR